MAADPITAARMMSLVDPAKGTVDRSLFYDEEIYQLEMEQIFARAWLFMCHQSQIPNPGDFFLNFMGEDRVIVVRNNEGGISVLVNSCRHRGNAVCRADEGHATSFMCTYHGWTYDLNGALVGVPGFKEVYHEELDRENWGLIRAPQVDSYQGLVFATMDAEAPPLLDYLGEAGRMGIDLLMNQGTMKMIPGVHKFVTNCNWKFPSDNTPDHYHATFTHASARFAGYGGAGGAPRMASRPSISQNYYPENGFTVLSDYGQGFAARFMQPNWRDLVKSDRLSQWRLDPEIERKMGPLGSRVQVSHLNVFPNLFVPTSSRNLAIRMPKGPTKTEIWMFTLVDSDQPQDIQDEYRLRTAHHFGPGGMMEQDDGENWDQSTAAARGVVSARHPLNYAMAVGHGSFIEDEEGPTRIGSQCNEHAQLWTYRCWAEMMAAPSWQAYRESHTRPGAGLVV